MWDNTADPKLNRSSFLLWWVLLTSMKSWFSNRMTLIWSNCVKKTVLDGMTGSDSGYCTVRMWWKYSQWFIVGYYCIYLALEKPQKLAALDTHTGFTTRLSHESAWALWSVRWGSYHVLKKIQFYQHWSNQVDLIKEFSK